MSLDNNFANPQTRPDIREAVGRNLLAEIEDDLAGPLPPREMLRGAESSPQPERFPDPSTLQEGEVLNDRAGNLRVARGRGGNISVDMVNGSVSEITAPNFRLTRLPNGDYQVTTTRPDGTTNTETFRNATVSVRVGPLAPGLQNQGEFVHISVNVNGRMQAGTSLLLRPAPER